MMNISANYKADSNQTNKTVIEYRARPVQRWEVTRWDEFSGSQQRGIFENEQTAIEVAKALAVDAGGEFVLSAAQSIKPD